MTTLTKVLATLTISVSLVGAVNATQLIATDDRVSTDLCMVAAQGNRAQLHNAIKNSGLSKSFVVYNVKCNEQNITEFVAQHGKSPKKIIALLNKGRNKGKVSINDIAAL